MGRILVVDDEKSIRVTLSEFLRDDGHEVRVAEDVMAATELMAREEFDLVVTDIILPRVSGVELLKAIRESSPHSLVIMMTGEPTVETAAESVRAGAFDYLAKPITKHIALKSVRNALKVKELNDEKQRLEAENRRYQQNLEQMVEKRTAQVEAEKARVDHLNTVLRAIRDVNQLITQEKDRDKLLKDACNILIETRGYSNTWIALFDEDKRATVTFESGMGASFEPMAERLGRGELPHCTTRGLGQKDVVVVEDPLAECGDGSLSGQYSGRAVMCIRLEHGDKVFGLLSVSNQLEFARDEEELSLLKEVADDIAFALHGIEIETERRRTEEALRESESKHRRLHSMLRLMCDNLPELIWAKDLQSRFLFANKACCEDLLNATDTDEPIGKDDMFFGNREIQSHPENPNYHTFGVTCTGSDSAVLESQKAIRAEESGNIKGTFVVLDVHKAPFRDADGSLIGTVGTARDVTREKEVEKARREAEEALRKSEEKFRSYIENAPDGIFISDVGGRYVDVNRAACRMTGYSREELLGMSFPELISPDSPPGLLESSNKLKETGNAQGEGLLRRKDGTDIPASLEAVVLSDHRFMAFCSDITERKRLQEQFLQAQKMESVGRLAGGVAHDFNNLLTVILSYCSFMGKTLREGDPLLGDVRQIEGAGKRAVALTRQLLAFSRKQILQTEVLDLNRTLENLGKMLRRLIGEDIDIATKMDPSVWKVEADPGQIEQIVLNLAVNARDAMPKGGKLTIETANVELDEEYARNHIDVTPGPYVMLAVSDTGLGMDAETAAQVFDPFFTTKEKDKGTGLGLSTVYGIVKQHEGNIWVYSEPGKGTMFKIYLPRAKTNEITVTKDSETVKDSRGTETVLMVEDEKAVLKLGVRVLESEGYKVLQARDGLEGQAVANAYEGPIHLLLTDVVMPRSSGKELSEKLLATRPELKVLYMSGYTDNAIVHHGVLDKGTHFLQKPFSVDSLAQKVREVLSESGGAEEPLP